jgi:hypothetical protein
MSWYEARYLPVIKVKFFQKEQYLEISENKNHKIDELPIAVSCRLPRSCWTQYLTIVKG